MLVGAVVGGALSDRFGRKKALVGCKLLEIVFGVAGSLAPNYVVFVIFRLGVAACALAAYTVGFVLSIEMMGPKYRPKAPLSGFFALGFCLLSGYAFAIRDFRKLQLVLSLPLLVFISYIWIIPESPRWLVSKGRIDEAMVVLNRIAKTNGKRLPVDFKLDPPDESVSPKKANLLDLFRYPRMRIRTIIMFFNWFVTSMVYFGLSLNTASLSGDIFFNTFMNALVEIPGWLFVIFSMNKIGRRWVLAASEIIAGIAMVTCAVFINYTALDTARTAVSLIGKMWMEAAFVSVYIFSAELFPTSVRNVGVGAASTFSRIAGMLSPQLARLDQFWPPLPSLIFGLFCLTAGGLVFLLPETKGKQLPETLAEGEDFGRLTTNTEHSLTDNDQLDPILEPYFEEQHNSKL